MDHVIRDFLPELWVGFMVNLEIGLGAVVVGFLVGMPLALLRQAAPGSRRFVWPCVRLMQAAPTYVVMYFMLSILPRDMTVFGIAATGLTAVTLAQSVYLASYIADNGYRALEHLRRNERDLALLFIPNLLRGTLLSIMSSGFGAAIGVSEAVAVTMRHAETLHTVGQRVILFAVVIALSCVVFGGVNALIQLLVRRLSARKKLAPAE